LKKICLPSSYNYIGAFLTLKCNLHCPYCINHFGEFLNRKEMTGDQWISALQRIETREDLPITLQGGEPTIYRDFYEVASGLVGQKMDLLTNGNFSIRKFIDYIDPLIFNRKSPYANIRFSYHKDINDVYLFDKLSRMKKLGYSVGVWAFDINDNTTMKEYCNESGVEMRIKQFLSDKHGTYKYPDAINGIKRKCECKPSELLIAPDGLLYRCHADLYAGVNSYAHILDEDITLPTDFLPCDRYCLCNTCDVKLKTNRLQQGGHCSVEVRNVREN
jgi:sulfatase maturation enzyme AslB (radical SAM superfamily)